MLHDFDKLTFKIACTLVAIGISCNIINSCFELTICKKDSNNCQNKCCIGKQKETWTDLSTGNKLIRVVVTKPK